MQEGHVEFIEVESLVGAECWLRDPVPGDLTVCRDAKAAEVLRGPMLLFPTQKGETLVLVAAGTFPASFQHAVPV